VWHLQAFFFGASIPLSLNQCFFLGELLPNFDLKKLFLNYEQDFS
jgi:hypothetical protein